MSAELSSANDVIVTAVSGYEPKHMAAWYNSLKATGYRGRTVAVAYDVSEALVDYMKHMGSFGITFNHDPEDNLAPGKDLLIGEESITHEDPWNRRNVLKTYGRHAYDRVAKVPVCCAGYFAGRYEAMMDFMLAVYYFDQTKRSGDQAAFNQLLTFCGWKEKAEKVNWQVPWLLHAVSANVGPDAPGFCMPRETAPVFEDGLVKTFDKQPYAIVHQYDRNKEMTAYFMEKFGKVE